ncbi:MAG: putative metal-dependent HD superfamily phosphohydrolase [Gammaproteobacteria bacterium]
MIVTSISEIRDSDLELEVESLYSPALAYHNFQHARNTISAAEHITRRCIDEGIRVDHSVVYYALLFHDAGFYDDHVALGFKTKEAYSAELAATRLKERRVPPKTIAKVIGAILSTHKDASFVTVEQKAVRAADLSGLAAKYDVFRKNTADLKIEHELFNAVTLSWPAWVENASKTIRFYLSQEIRLTSYFVNEFGESAFHQAVRENLEHLIEESC